MDRLREVLVPLQGVALAPEVWERDVLPRRVGAYSPAWMDQLCASGELVWVGAGALGRSTGKVALYFREDARWIGPPPIKADAPAEPLHDAIRERLRAAPSFWSRPARRRGRGRAGRASGGAVGPGVGGRGDQRRLRAAARAAPVAGTRAARAAAAASRRRRRPGAPQVQGRWSLTEPLFADAPAHGPRMRALSELLLERYGIVTRETVLAEGVPGGFAALYGELANLETLGTARRGYFVEGLGGAQFALPAAIERLRGLRADEAAGPLVLAATDPANPFGATLPWPNRDDGEAGGRRPSRVPGAYVVTLDAEPVLYVERGGKGLLPLRDAFGADGLPEPWLARRSAPWPTTFARAGSSALRSERFDGEPVVGSALEPLLVEIGFRQGPRRLTLSA